VAESRLGRGEAGWGLAQRFLDHSQDALQIFVHFIIPEAQYAKAMASKMSIALHVTSRMRIEIMLPTVQLDYQPMLEADEIQDVPVAG
jgi:hypothetical protein